MPMTSGHIEPDLQLNAAERAAERAAWKELDSLISEAHDTLHKVLTVFIPSNDAAHEEVSNLMKRLRAAMSASQ